MSSHSSSELADLADIQSGFAFPSKGYTKQGHFLMRIGNVQDGRISLDKPKFVALDKKTEKFALSEGDFLTSLTGYIGRVAKIEAHHLPAALNQRVARLRVKPDKAFPEYVGYFLQTDAFRLPLEEKSHGAAQANVSPKEIARVPIPLPPLEEQKRIVAVLDQAFAALDRARANAEANLADAEELFSSFLENEFFERKKWSQGALGDRVRFIDYRGKTPPKTDAGVLLITAKNVRMGFIKPDPREFIEEEAYDAWMTRGFPAIGDVLFTTEAPLANVAQLDTDEKVVIGQRLITFKTDATKIAPSFLKWSLISPQMQSEIHSQATGATVLGIKAKLLKKIALFVPQDIEVQKAVAVKCEEAFRMSNDLAAAYKGKLTDLADLRQSLLQKAFAGELTNATLKVVS